MPSKLTLDVRLIFNVILAIVFKCLIKHFIADIINNVNTCTYIKDIY